MSIAQAALARLATKETAAPKKGSTKNAVLNGVPIEDIHKKCSDIMGFACDLKVSDSDSPAKKGKAPPDKKVMISIKTARGIDITKLADFDKYLANHDLFAHLYPADGTVTLRIFY